MSLLTTLQPEAIVRQPFPHMVVEHALEESLCEALTREFPPLESFVKGRVLPENKKIVRRNTGLLADPALSPAWRTMIEEHLQPAVFADWLALFGDELRREHPSFEAEHGDPGHMRVGRRGLGDAFTHDVFLDAALVAHTPVTSRPCAERGPHLKEPNKPFLGFLFLRPEEDEADGAEIELYAVKDSAAPASHERNQIDPADLELIRRIPYRRNTLLLMLNTPRTITTHAARGTSPVPMQYFHILAELPRPLFRLPQAAE